jgi:type IV pilus assembly protein PilQ
VKNLIRLSTLLLFTVQSGYVPLQGDPSADIPAVSAVEVNNDQISLNLTQLMPYDVFSLTSPDRLVIEIPGTVYKGGNAIKRSGGGLVKRVRGYQFKENPLISRIVVDLNAPVDYKAQAVDNKVVVSLTENKLSATESSSPKKVEAPRVSRKRDLLTSLPKDDVTLDFEGADIKDVIRLMSETSSINMIFGPEVSGTIAIHLKKVPFDEAFSTILNLKGLVPTQLGANILRITTPEILQKERQKAVMYTKTIPINYLKAEEMQTHIQAMIASAGRKGTLTVAHESNSLVLTDSEEGIAQAERLIAQLDKRPKQVMIEARIVEINLNNGFDMGVQWEFAKQNNTVDANGNIIKSNSIGTIVQDLDKSRIQHGLGVIGSPNADTTFGAGTPPNGTGVSLPGPTNAAIEFGIVKAGEILDVSLAALVTQSKAKILSAPKVVTLNGESARIQAVQDIRFRTSTVSNGVVTSDFKTVSAGIILTVTPTINAEDRVTLKINPESSFPTADSTEAGPIIRTRTAQTTVVIKDGDTLVIGGLIDDQDSKGVSKVPLLGDIPIIGAFFRSTLASKTRNELLIFVTPRIVRD